MPGVSRATKLLTQPNIDRTPTPAQCTCTSLLLFLLRTHAAASPDDMNPFLSCCNPSISEFHQLTAKPLHFNDAIGEQSVHCERDRLIQRVRNREAELVQLASSSSNKTSPFILSGEATISAFLSNFQTFRNASCTFLHDIASRIARAARSKVRWLQCCRCPFHLDINLDISKLLMASNCLAENTTIPVPKVLAYSTNDNYGLFLYHPRLY